MILETSNPIQASSSSRDTLQVLHLAGSSVSDFYYNLSLVYAKEVIQPAGTSSYYAIVHPEGFWQLGSSLDNLSEKLSFQEMLSCLPKVDLVVPHMFCPPGMTSYRALFEDILGIPVVGSLSNCTALATNKSQTRSVVSAAGVRVAKAQLISQKDEVTMKPPFVVKPNSEDNSLGVTLVWEENQIKEALQQGFKYDDQLLVEEYIPGREIRVAVIEHQGELYIPSTIEYLVSEENPIRTVKEKLKLNSDGMPVSQPEEQKVIPICPGNVSSELFEKLADAAKKSHKALGCRHYSLYDFRIHAENGEPYLLEAGLFWTFSRISMISSMIRADGEDLEEIIMDLWQNVGNKIPVTTARYSIST